MDDSDYEKVSPWPRIRNLTELMLRNTKPCTIHGESEHDVTLVLERLAALGEEHPISLNTYVLYALSRIAARHEVLRTYRHGRRCVVFRHVDLTQPMLKTLPDGRKLPVLHIVRRADTKSLAQIHAELRGVGAKVDLADDKAVRFRRALVRLPYWVQTLLYRRIVRHPLRLKRYFGNLGLTTMRQSGFDIPMVGHPPNIYSAQFLLGNVFERFLPDEHRQPVLRSLLQVAGSFDHLIMDGMQISSFVRDLSEFFARAEGLDDDLVRELSGGQREAA